MPTSVFNTYDGVGVGVGGSGGDGVGAQRPCVELTHAPLDRNALTQHAPLLLEAQSLEQPAPSQKTPVLLTLHVAARRRRAFVGTVALSVGGGVGTVALGTVALGVGGGGVGEPLLLTLHCAC